jgi:positive regulator of sigma E activity
MIERGVVIKNDLNGIDVRMHPSSACKSCGACFVNEGEIQVLRINQILDVCEGDSVEIEVKPSFAIKSALLIFFLPLLMMLFGYFLFQNFLNFTNIFNIYKGIIGAFLGLILSFVGLYFYDRKILTKKPNNEIHILRVIK